MQFIFAVLIGLLVLGVLVFVHELGHFAAAKACKIRVMAFAIGFGRPLYRFRIKGGETEYRINSIPFGGYVAMASDSPIGETAGGDNEFNSHPIWQRAVVALAGPIANFVFALVTLWVMFVSGVERPAYLDNPTIGIVIGGSAAESAGFLAGDSIVAVNGKAVSTWEQVETELAQRLKEGYVIDVLRGGREFTFSLNLEQTGARLSADPTGGILPSQYPPVIGEVLRGGSAENILAAGDTLVAVVTGADTVVAANGAGDTVISVNEVKTAITSFDQFAFMVRGYDPESGPLTLVVKRGGEVTRREVTPAFDSERERYMVGVSPAAGQTKLIRYNPIAAVKPTIAKSWEYTTMIFDVLGKLTSGQVSANQLAGPLNIIPVSGMMAFQGLATILNFMALIGINLAVLNLLPLVITDGGLLMFLLIEAVRGKPLPVKAQMLINKIFIALFLALFLFVSINDVQRLPDFFKMLR